MIRDKVARKISDTIVSCQEGVRGIRINAEDLHAKLTSIEGMLFAGVKNINNYIPTHFKLYELVPPELYEHVDHSVLWGQFDSRELWTADALREKYGSCIINDWYWGGSFVESGLRLPNTTTGVQYSQHKRGAATDKKFMDISVEDILKDLKENPGDPAFKYITTVEQTHKGKTPTWLHTDCRNWESYNGIVFLLL